MARDDSKMVLMRGDERHIAEFKWTISKGRDTYGYNICTCFVDGHKVGQVNGGGYDMMGASISHWVALKVKPDAQFYGLTWHDPDYRTPERIKEREAAGESLGLEAYQDFYAASSKKRTERHTVAMVDGACGLDTVLSGAGFKSWSINEYSTKEVKDYLKRWDDTGEKVTDDNFSRIAWRHGFKPGAGRYWERWPTPEETQ